MTAVDDTSKASGEVRFEQPSPDTLQLSFAGSWRLQDQRPAPAGFEAQLASTPGSRRVTLLSTELGAWDSGLVTYLARVVSLCRERNIEVDASGLPEGARRLLELAFAVPPKKDTGKHGEQPPTVTRIGMTVLDLGCAPGGWSQVAAELVGHKGRVIASDILPMDNLAGVEFVLGDFTEDEVFEQILALIGDEPVDLVMSDMAPNMSGMNAVDQPRSMYLFELALDMARQVLTPGGSFVAKVFHGEGFDELIRDCRDSFGKVLTRKPQASRPSLTNLASAAKYSSCSGWNSSDNSSALS